MTTALELTVINEALVLIGDRPITGLEDPSNEDDPSASVLASQIYDVVVNTALAEYRWRWCRDVSEVVATEEELIPAGWDSAWQRPPGAINIAAIYSERRTHAEFDIFGDIIAVRGISVGASPVFCEHTIRRDENLWPAMFRMGVVHSLASAFCSAILENARLSEFHANAAAVRFKTLAGQEAQQRTPSKVDLSLLKRGRRGSRMIT